MSHVTRRMNLQVLLAGALALAGLSLAKPTLVQAQDQFDVVGNVADSSGAALNGAMIVALTLPDSVLARFALTNGSAMPASGKRLARDIVAGATSPIDSCLRASSTVKAVVHTCLLGWPSIDTCRGRPRRRTIVPVWWTC